jgi:hypothetical protein
LETPTIGPICCGNGQGGRLRASFNATETVEFQPGELAEVRERHSARSSGASRIATNAQAFGGSRSPGVVPAATSSPRLIPRESDASRRDRHLQGAADVGAPAGRGSTSTARTNLRLLGLVVQK